jgi:hypothetical protein
MQILTTCRVMTRILLNRFLLGTQGAGQLNIQRRTREPFQSELYFESISKRNFISNVIFESGNSDWR